MNLFFIENPETVIELLASSGPFDRERDIVVYWRWEVWETINERRLQGVLIDGDLPEEVAREIDARADELALNWADRGDCDVMEYRGVSVAELLSFDLRFPIGLHLKWRYIVERRLAQYRPAQVFHDLPHGSEIYRIVAASCALQDLHPKSVRPEREMRYRGSLDRFYFSTYAPELVKFAEPGPWTTIRALREVIRGQTAIMTAMKVMYTRSQLLRKAMSIIAPKYNRLFFRGYGQKIVIVLSSHHIDVVLESWLKRKNRPFVLCIDLNSPPKPGLLMRLTLFSRSVYLLKPTVFRRKHKHSVARQLEDRAIRHLETIAREGYFMVSGKDLSDGIREYMIQSIRKNTYALLKRIDYYYKFFDDYKISGVLVPYDTPLNYRLVVRVAQRREVPTIVLQHGVPANLVYENRTAEHIAVWGDRYRELYLEAGMASKKILVTGGPSFSRYEEAITLLKSEARKRRPKSILIVTTNPGIGVSYLSMMANEFRFLDCVRAISKFAEARRMRILLRIHPHESIERYRDVARHAGVSNLRIDRGQALSSLISNADLVITLGGTTVALEAMLFGKKTISVLPPGKFRVLPPYDGSGSLRIATGVEALEQELEQAVRDGELVDSYIDAIASDAQGYLGKVSGVPGDRVLNAMDEVIASVSS